ncbi:MAG: glycogen phosphorylase [Deltaproteobacteria bacterium GWA2_57_13]|nr:MAG: glycogen phosphorylase [Deltaproteobacteria bacterium GWA2_57_13]OGQ81473.1 MAG: glycogen phosphorylase [Deltaproteobacteria bacterium RIFCSPLOWO2_12_FULL_57_22]
MEPLSKQDERGLIRFTDTEHYDRHLMFDHAVSLENASQRERFEAVARVLRDLLTQRWLLTQQAHDRENPKRVYYLSMEFLIGRTLVNNVINLGVEQFLRQDLRSDPRQDWRQVIETEPDAGLGNGGLGRLAACFIDSLATLQIPAMGYGLRYEYGIFRQEIQNGYQVEYPDHWLRYPDPWEVARPRETVQVPLGCSFRLENRTLRALAHNPTHLLGVPYDRPVVGYGGRTINTLRLWAAASPEFFDFGEFSSGDFVEAILGRTVAETLTRVLYPADSTRAGQVLRFFQEHFLVCCSLADIVARFRRTNADWRALPDKVAIQLNETHPAMAVAELMRILLDEARLGWDESWDLTVCTLAYTNHTLLPEALEKWPVRFFELACPRLLEIIYEINSRFLDDVRQRYPADEDRVRRMSFIEETPIRQVRMANLAIVGTHSTNGVAAIHSELVRTQLVPDFARMFPDRFNNKTNGVTPRRWLLLANPELSRLITEAIGDGWVTDLAQLRKIAPLADDNDFRAAFRKAKQAAKARFAKWLKAATGQVVDPATIFDSQIKRIHEYKRQLLNLLHIVMLYNRLRANSGLSMPPRTFFFAGKAAPAYRLAKLIIKLINNVGQVLDGDPTVRDRLKLVFLPDYNVSLAERLIPGSDVSEQISTAGYEASGTSNMKLMMNGALTVGTRDGATIEIAEEAGEDNLFLFGLTAEQVANSRGWYSSWWHYENEPEIRQAVDLIFGDHFSRNEPTLFVPIRETLLERGDYYMHLADLTSYAQAQQRVADLYADPEAWSRKAIINVACSGKFSSDRTIAEYAAKIWDARPCPVE